MQEESTTVFKSIAGINLYGVSTGLFIDWQEVSILLAKRVPGGSMGERWEIPGGKLEPGEDFRKAIIREFQEEFYLEPMIGPFLVSADFINNGKRYRVDAYQIMLEMLPEQTPEHSEIKIVNLQKTLTLPLVDSDRSLIQTLFKNRPQIKSMFTQT